MTSVLAAAQFSVIVGSLLVGLVLSLMGGSLFAWLLISFSVAVMAFIGVNLVTTFVVLPVRLLFRWRVSWVTTILLSAFSGAIIYASANAAMIEVQIRYAELQGPRDIPLQILALYLFIGGVYGFLFGLSYYKLETHLGGLVTMLEAKG